MKTTRTLLMAVLTTSVLAAGGGSAQAATPATAPTPQAVPRASNSSYASSIETRAKSDAEAAGQSIAAAARYMNDELSSAGPAAEHDTAKGLKAVASFSERLADRVTDGMERAWSTVANTAHRAVAKLA